MDWYRILYGDFFEKNSDSQDQYFVYLVTNKHVIKNLDSILIRFNPQNEQPAKNYLVPLKDKGEIIWTGHPNNNIDVAVLPLNVNVLEPETKYSFFQSDKHVLKIKEMQERELSEGDFIYIMGFPMGIIAEDRQHVFVRGGIVSRIKDLFESRSTDFVVDAFVFPGNSGGPVISKPEVHSISGTKSPKEASLIGIVKSYIPYKDVAISAQTKQQRVIFEENTGLSKVEPVDHIIATIQEAKKRVTK